MIETLTVESVPAAATHVPSGWNATLVTMASASKNVCAHDLLLRSHSLTCLGRQHTSYMSNGEEILINRFVITSRYKKAIVWRWSHRPHPVDMS